MDLSLELILRGGVRVIEINFGYGPYNIITMLNCILHHGMYYRTYLRVRSLM
jgi:hypothetical protein